MNISYIRLLQAIESFASAHLQIQKFASDFPSQMPNFATTDEAYPILFVSPTTSIFDENTTTFEVDIYCFDIIQKDRGNINTILSDTNLILSDFTRWFRDNDDIFIELMSSSATPIDNALLDYAAGWVMRVVFEVSTYGVCEIPFDEAPVVITEVNDIVYSRWLTCETLEDCPVIINIQDQLSGLTGSTGEYLPLSGGTMYSGASIFFNNNTKISEGIVDAGTGGNKGIALTCAVGYEWKWEAGEAYLTNLSGNIIDVKQYARTIPSVNDDISKGFIVGTNWFMLDGSRYVCSDSTIGSAVWEQVFFIPNLQDVTTAGSITTNSMTVESDFFNTIIETSGVTTTDLGTNEFTSVKPTGVFITNNSSMGLGLSGTTGIGLNSGNYQWKFENGEIFLYDVVNNFILIKDYSTSIPLPTDDISIGYVSGSLWKIGGQTYQCLVPTIGAAVWDLVVNYGNLQLVTDNGNTTTNTITASGFTGDYLEFNTTATETSAVGKMYWNDADGTVDLGLKGGNVTLQIGQETVLRVVNKTATNIDLLQSNYQAVRITGAQGQRPKVDLALGTNDLNSAETIGLVTETINNNQEGFITTSGIVRGINTTGSLQGETWADGDILYLSPTVAGRITKVKPIAPNHLVIVGYVIYTHINNGKIFVKVDNGYELDELHNVRISGVSNNDILTYNSSLDVWENKQLNTLTGLTVNGNLMVTGTTTSTTISGTTLQTNGFTANTNGLTANTISATTYQNLPATPFLPLSGGTVTGATSFTSGLTANTISATTYQNLQNSLKTFNRTQGIYYFEEFMGNNAGSVPTSYNTVITLSSGNATARSVATTNRTNQQGIIQHSTGTGASNFTGYAYGSSLYIGSGTISLETYLTVETLSTVTERFMTYFGYAGGSSNYLNIPSGIFFSYDEGGVQFSAGAATPNWKCYTRVTGGTVTLTTTSVPVVAAQWYKLRIDINSAGNSVTFYIDNTLVATHTTNIPSVTTAIAPISIMNKTIGTSARTMLTDYFMYEEIFTNAR